MRAFYSAFQKETEKKKEKKKKKGGVGGGGGWNLPPEVFNGTIKYIKPEEEEEKKKTKTKSAWSR